MKTDCGTLLPAGSDGPWVGNSWVNVVRAHHRRATERSFHCPKFGGGQSPRFYSTMYVVLPKLIGKYEEEVREGTEASDFSDGRRSLVSMSSPFFHS